MSLKKIASFLSIVLFSLTILKAQQKDDDLIQFAGVIVSSDSSRLLPLVSIRIKGSRRGSYTDASGFFSMVVKRSDTVIFSSLGMKPVEYTIPQGITQRKYSIIQPMKEDTLFLPETIIRPGPTPEEFNYYFVRANIPDEYFSRASGNLRSKGLQDPGYSVGMDANEVNDYTQKSQAYQYYYQGQLPPQRLFDVMAWSQFFDAWKKGDYQKK